MSDKKMTGIPKKFGKYGGQFVPETLMPALIELEKAYVSAQNDSAMQADLAHLFKTYVGRPTPLTFAARLTQHLGGAKIYLQAKRPLSDRTRIAPHGI